MAVITLEGLIEIDLADVFAWLQASHTITEEVGALRFSIEDDALVLEMGADHPLRYIEAADLWKWVIEQHLPAGINHYETAFGVPAIDKSKGLMSISFASSSDGHPSSWAKPPACLAQWKRDTSEDLFRDRTPEAAARQMAITLAWLAECQLATLEGLLERKSSSKSEIERQRHICDTAVRQCEDLGIRPGMRGLRGTSCSRLDDELRKLIKPTTTKK